MRPYYLNLSDFKLSLYSLPQRQAFKVAAYHVYEKEKKYSFIWLHKNKTRNPQRNMGACQLQQIPGDYGIKLQ